MGFSWIIKRHRRINTNQAYNNGIPHGNPAIFATQYADIAIFRALINETGVEGDCENAFGINNNVIHFSATQNMLDAAKEKTGKIYILPKSKFSEPKGTECISKEPIIPKLCIEVTYKDLPKGIHVIKQKSAS